MMICTRLVDKTLSFLETLVIRKIKLLEIKLQYKKPTFTGCYINYFSHQPLNQGIGIIYFLFDRAIKLAHKKFHVENLYLKECLLLIAAIGIKTVI